MPDTRSACVSKGSYHLGVTLSLLSASLISCQPAQEPPPLNLNLHQQWELQPGDTLSGYLVSGGLGDISIELGGNSVYAPFSGTAQPDQRRCLIFSTPDIPAYLFRLCGLSQPRYGSRNAGEPLGQANTLQLAALRKQPNGTWAIVEPSKHLVERVLTR